MPPLVHTAEPPQRGPKRAEVESPSQPLFALGYKRPDQYDKDDPVFDVISALLSSGRTSLMERQLVRDKKLALAVDTSSAFPDSRYPNVFLIMAMPNLGRTVAENEKAIFDLLDEFKSKPPDSVALQRVKTKTRADVIRSLDSNSRLAALLTAYYASYGDWRKLFTSIDDVDKVTAGDVQRIARQYFVQNSLTVALTVPPGGQKGAGK
jgi:predicted Zn-dependent peptidase